MSTTFTDTHNNTSCWGCKWLYQIGVGYSNYTWESDDVNCALDKNKNLPAERPFLEADETMKDWIAIKNCRCTNYLIGEYIVLDVDGEFMPDDYSTDIEQIKTIENHSGRKRDIK